MNSKEHLQLMARDERINACTCAERGENDDACEHNKAALMYELQSQATHKLDNNLYQVSGSLVLLLNMESLQYINCDVSIADLTLINRG